MKYFKHLKYRSPEQIVRIFSVVYNLDNYAKSIYKGLWEDALDKSFFHILDNYDEECGGDLEHYAISVVGKIGLNKYSHEIENEISLTTALDQKAIDEDTGINLDELFESEEDSKEDIQECITYLTPKFIRDYKFFATKNTSLRTCDYSGMFEKFSSSTITTTMNWLVDNYGSSMERLLKSSSMASIKKLQIDYHETRRDTDVAYNNIIYDVLLYRSNVVVNKVFYYLDLNKVIQRVLGVYYFSEDSKCFTEIEEHEVYCSLSGKLVYSLKEICELIEQELLWVIFSRLPSLRLMSHVPGEYLVASNPKEMEEYFGINIFDREFGVCFKRLVSSRVNTEGV